MAEQECDISDLESKYICYICVKDQYLSKFVEDSNDPHQCSYCNIERNCIDVMTLANWIGHAFENHYELAVGTKEEDRYTWEGEPVIEVIIKAAGVKNIVALDVQKILQVRNEEFGESATEFTAESYYKKKDIEDRTMHISWAEFEHSLRTQGRFFNKYGSEFLASIFDDITELKINNGRNIVRQVGPNTDLSTIFRARVFQSRDSLIEALTNPEKSLGPPPSEISRPGRMNAFGISVFYGSDKPAVALAEVRPPIGSKVLISGFKIVRNLRLLDLTALADIDTTGSVFDPEYLDLLRKADFFKSLTHFISAPVMPNDENISYIITQATADYLAADRKNRFDGIIYSSVQFSGLAENIVLFQHASRVRILRRDERKTKVGPGYTYQDNKLQEDYWVRETILRKTNIEANDYIEIDSNPDSFFSDSRLETLELDRNSISVHNLAAIKYSSESINVKFSSDIISENEIDSNLPF